MSDKGLLFKKRKNNHGSHHKCSSGSGFPRHAMNHYPGTHLGMRLRYSKPSVGRLYCEWGPNRGYLRTNRITGFINKFIGKPYNDLVKAFYILIKDLRDSHKEVGLSDLEWHFEQFRHRRWRGDYYVDDDGLVQVVHPETARRQTSHINKQQVAYNKKVKIPDFGRVSLPRTPGRETNNRYCLPEYGSVSYEKPQYDAPRFLGNYWCDIQVRCYSYLYIMFQVLTCMLNIGLTHITFLNLKSIRKVITTVATHRDGIEKGIVISLVICLDLEILHLSGHKV